MKKKILSILLIVSSMAFTMSGCTLKREDVEPPSTELSEVAKTTTLESESFYVWSDATFKKSDITHYTFGGDEEDGVVNPERIIWYSEIDEESIPTVYAGDEIVYCCSGIMPEEFRWERFEDLGYTVGLTQLEQLPSKKYALSLDVSDEHIYDKSDVWEAVSDYSDVGLVIVDKIGGVSLTDACVDESGTIVGLAKGAPYDMEYYVGTFMKEATVTASYHAFSSMEDVYSVDYDFLQSDIAVIKVPEGLKTGYYLLGGEMFFRYVNGSSYDQTTDFNEPNVEEDDFSGSAEEMEDAEIKEETTFNPQVVEKEETTETTESTELETGTEMSMSEYADYTKDISFDSMPDDGVAVLTLQFKNGTDWESQPLNSLTITDSAENILFDLLNDSEYQDISWEWNSDNASLIIKVPNEGDYDLANLTLDFNATDAYQKITGSVE